MVTGIMGGTFNPVHNGHLKVADLLIKNKICDEIIFIVAGNPPHKISETDEIHRFNMVKLAIENTQFKVSDIEIGKNKKSYTIDTMEYLTKKYPDKEIRFITGADAFCDIPIWHNGEELLKKYRFIAVNRDFLFKNTVYKSRLNDIIYKYGADVIVADVQTPLISSSEIREKIKSGASVEDLIPRQVLLYIEKHELYK